MSLAQIAVSDWFLLLGTALGWLLIIIFMVTTQRELSRLRADFKLLSDEVTELMRTEEARIMREIRKTKTAPESGNKADVRSPSLGPQ
jgi:hypothetical protein